MLEQALLDKITQFGGEVVISTVAILVFRRIHREIVKVLLNHISETNRALREISQYLGKLNLHLEFIERKIGDCCGSDKRD